MSGLGIESLKRAQAMAGRARSRYQGGASFNVFSAQGSNPTGDCKLCGKGVQKVYDRLVKGYVYSCSGGPSSKLQLPKDESRAGLQLLQPFLVLQLYAPAGQQLSLELRVSDSANTRRKMYFSTSFSEIKTTPLHCQIPISMVVQNTWLSLSIHVADLFSHCFKGMSFRSVDVIVLGPVCKLRKIFTMRNRLAEMGGGCATMEFGGEECLPQEHMFALGVETAIQVLDMAALQTAITGLADSSADGVRAEFGHTAKKSTQNKMDGTRQVHVAFGSRMPLPLSTVQINTSLPGDHKNHVLGAFSKNRAGRLAHVQNEPFLVAPEHKWSEVKGADQLLQSLLKHTSVTATDLESGKIKELKLSGTKPIKTDEFSLGLASLSESSMGELDAPKKRVDAMTSVLKPVIECHEQESPAPTTSLGAGSVEPESSDAAVDVDKVFPGKLQKVVKKKEETNVKRDVPASGLTKHPRRDSHWDCSRGKEYQHLRYMDSPPLSPPCGWDSCIDGGFSEDKPFSECVFEGLSLFSKPGELEDVLGPTEKSPSLAASHSFSPVSVNSGKVEQDMAKIVGHNTDASDSDLIPEDLPSRQTNEDAFQTIIDNLCKLQEDNPRPVGVTLEKFDLGDDKSFLFRDSMFTSMSDEDISDGGASWSSGSFQEPISDPDVLVTSPGNSNILSHGIDSCGWELGTDPHMHDSVNKRRFENKPTGAFQSLEQPWSLCDEEDTEASGCADVDIRLIGQNSPVEVRGTRVQESFDFGSEEDEHGGSLPASPPFTQTLSKMSDRDVNNLTGVSKHSGSHDTAMSSSSWHFGESLAQCSEFSFPMKTEPGIATEEPEAQVLSNGRPEEDLDLLYDPTLDCYYDPKTNRYYELK